MCIDSHLLRVFYVHPGLLVEQKLREAEVACWFSGLLGNFWHWRGRWDNF